MYTDDYEEKKEVTLEEFIDSHDELRNQLCSSKELKDYEGCQNHLFQCIRANTIFKNVYYLRNEILLVCTKIKDTVRIGILNIQDLKIIQKGNPKEFFNNVLKASLRNNLDQITLNTNRDVILISDDEKQVIQFERKTKPFRIQFKNRQQYLYWKNICSQHFIGTFTDKDSEHVKLKKFMRSFDKMTDSNKKEVIQFLKKYPLNLQAFETYNLNIIQQIQQSDEKEKNGKNSQLSQNRQKKQNSQVQKKRISQKLKQKENQIAIKYDQLKRQLEQVQSKLKEANQHLSDSKCSWNVEKKQLEETIRLEKVKNENISLKALQIQGNKKVLDSTVENLKEKYNQLEQEKNGLKEEVKSAERIKKQTEIQLQKIKKKAIQIQNDKNKPLQQAARSIQLLKKQLETYQRERDQHLFDGDALEGCSPEKRFLRQELETYCQRKIKSTRLIYGYDPLNKTNCHRYIDYHPHLLVIARLTNNRLVAAYSEHPLDSKIHASAGGLLLALSEQKTFKLLQGKRSVTYDDYFIIFGNSQLRLKTGELRFFTNFGIGNGFYDSQGSKYSILTGDTPRDTEATTFEFFEVFFAKQKEQNAES